ncbi:Acetate--CoA ligase [ADP-forming] I subunit alpha, partial [Lachnellula subtilissima]
MFKSFITTLSKMSTESTARAFFSAPQFAVVGASADPSKFGHKIFTWYTTHSLPVTPINPTAPSITANSKAYPTVTSLSQLPDPASTAVSIITPPKVTKKVLEEAKGLGVKSVWLQPGTFDDEVMAYARKEFENAVGGDGGGGGEGWCVLVDGGKALEGR